MVRSRASRHWLPGALALGALVGVLVSATQLGPIVRAFFADTVLPYTIPDRYEGLSKKELIERLTSAETELARVRGQSALYELLAEENASLRASTERVPGFDVPAAARILARPPRSSYDTLILDVGQSEGIRENDIVVFSGIALGRILSVSQSSSIAELYSSPGLERDVILGNPQAVAIASGKGGGSFEVSLPRDVSVAIGDPVRISRSETLALGTVVEIEGVPTDPTKIIRFRSPISLAALDYVGIISETHAFDAE